MIELTDDDRAAIRLEMYAHDAPEALYVAGIAAGLERAAKVCEKAAVWEYEEGAKHAAAAVDNCAAAIRALRKQP